MTPEMFRLCLLMGALFVPFILLRLFLLWRGFINKRRD